MGYVNETCPAVTADCTAFTEGVGTDACIITDPLYALTTLHSQIVNSEINLTVNIRHTSVWVEKAAREGTSENMK